MTPFSEILERATANAGGTAALDAKLPQPATAEALRSVADDRYLSQMCLRIFRAGLRHAVVDAKWPGFEEVFMGFDPHRVRAMPDEALEALTQDTRVIRHWGKIKSVRANAAALLDLVEETGDGLGAYLAAWPGDTIVGLWDDLAKRFSQLGGSSGATFLRMVGKDTFLLTPDVVRALNETGAFDGTPKGKRDRAAVQQSFNAWQDESGRPQCQISRILALYMG